jgi:hypothetical protein
MRGAWLACISLLLAFAATAAEPQWLTDARAREGKLAHERKLESPDGLLRARVPAKPGAAITFEDGDYRVNLEIGASGPIECLVTDDSDLAALLREAAGPTFELIASVQGKIEARGVERVDAGAIGASPYIAVDWIYRANAGETPGASGFKQFAATFRNAVHALVESLAYANAPDQPFFTEVAVVSMNGMRIGVSTNILLRDAEGNTQSEQRTSMLVPVGPETLQSSDVMHVHSMRPDATLIRSLYVESSNRSIESQLELQLGDDGAWHVEGKFKGKPLSAAWPGEEAPTTWLEEALTLRKRLTEENAEGASFSVMQWLASADPSTRTESKTTIGKSLDEQRVAVHQSGAGLEVDLVIEKKTGMPVSAVVPVGPSSLTIERVYVDGSF